MKKENIKVKSLCLIEKNNKILVAEGYDHIKNDYYYRPLGGTMEFGERSIHTVKRESLEELNAEVIDLRFFCLTENIFEVDGKLGHEIVFVYKGTFSDESLYLQDELTGIKSNGIQFRCLWLDINDCKNKLYRLVPEELNGKL